MLYINKLMNFFYLTNVIFIFLSIIINCVYSCDLQECSDYCNNHYMLVNKISFNCNPSNNCCECSINGLCLNRKKFGQKCDI